MDFDLSDEQVMLKESASRFLKDEYTPERRKEAVASPSGYDIGIWNKFAEFGWIGLPLSEDVGGLNGGAVDVMVLMECLGEAVVVEPYLASVLLAGRLLDKLGTEEQRQKFLPDVIAGKKTLAFAFAEPESRFELNAVQTTARTAGNDFILSGRKTMVLNGANADAVLVLARTGGEKPDSEGLSLFLVEHGSGVLAREYRNVDGSRAADLLLEEVTVGRSALVGTLGEALPPVRECVDFATLAVAAGAVGAMQVTNRITIEYLKTRQQFGVAIGSFQALQHRVVDMMMSLELARSLVMAAAVKLQENAPDTPRMVAAAKYECGKSGRFIGKNAVQLHGGIGVSQEYVIGHYFKHLIASDILLGDAAYQGKRYASLAD